MTIQVLRFAHSVASQWRNNGGVTHEIARCRTLDHANSFDWRISVADVTTPGPFSRFTGIDRVLVFCEGQEMVVTVDRVAYNLSRWTPFFFSGEADANGAVPRGATRDLNVMSDRARIRASVDIVELAGPHTLAVAELAELVVVVLEGSIEVSVDESREPSTLDEYDALRMRGVKSIVVEGCARVATAYFQSIDGVS